MSPRTMQARSACSERSNLVAELRDRRSVQPPGNGPSGGDRGSAQATESVAHDRDSGCQCRGSAASTIVPPGAAELEELSCCLHIASDDGGHNADASTASNSRQLVSQRQSDRCCHLTAVPAPLGDRSDYKEQGVVSVPVKELETLVGRLRVAKAEMDNLRKVVDMQTTVILKLKAKICTRQGPAGGVVEPACIQDGRGRRRELTSLSSSNVPPVSDGQLFLPQSLLTSDESGLAQPRSADLHRVVGDEGRSSRPACTATDIALVDQAVPRGRGQGNADCAREPTPPLCPKTVESSRSSPAASDRGSPLGAPQLRGRDEPDVRAPALTTSKTAVKSVADKNAALLDARKPSAAHISDVDVVGRRAKPVSAVRPNLFCALLPTVTPQSASRFVGENSRSVEAEDGRTTADAFSHAVPTPSPGRGCDTSNPPAAAEASGYHRRLGEPPSQSAATGAARHCPLCMRSFAADLPLSEYQCHVLECDLSNNEGVDVIPTPASSGPSGGGGNGGGSIDDDRTCPMCAAHYPAGLPRDEFERHVLSHFQDE